MTRQVIVCGGGSAGCIVAARLSEDPENDVLLIEAGADFSSAQEMPAHIRELTPTGSLDESTDWGFEADRDGLVSPRVLQALGVSAPDGHRVRRGKVIGGSGSVNASNALRPHPSDFQRWVALGATEWTYDALEPYLRRLEADDAPGPYHGRSGPVPIERFSEDELINYNVGFLEACREFGFRDVSDLNQPGAAGVGVTPKNRQGDVRLSSALAHLPAARLRPNFEVRAHAVVDRIEIESARARAVVLSDGESIAADTVVLSAGTINTPVILQRSGVGPRAVLDALGVAPVAVLDAVGRNLSDHPMFWLSFETTAEVEELTSVGQVALVCSPADPDADQAASNINLIPMKTRPGLQVAVGVTTPMSMGWLSARSRDPGDSPVIALNFFDHPHDLPRLLSGVKLTRRLMRSAPMRRYVRGEMFPGITGTEDDLGLARKIVSNLVASYYHPVGTCRMGEPGPWAAVDQDGAVHGIGELFVIDASIMPAIPAQPTNMMSMVIAERCADRLRQRWARQARTTTPLDRDGMTAGRRR
jgi:choline dehydrogenase